MDQIDTQIKANQDAAAKLGVTIPGVGNRQTTLAEDQARTARQNKPGYDAFGDPIQGYKAPAPVDTTTTLEDQKAEQETLSQQRLKAAEDANNQMTGIQNGSIPLSAGENAQIEELKQQFQQMIEQQKLTNTGATGTANIRGYQQGAAEYDPNFQTNIISSVISAGANKVANLNVRMASAVASLTQSLKDNDISKIKSAYEQLDGARKDRQLEIQKTVEATQKAIKEAQDAKIAADKVVYDTITKPINDIAIDVAKNGNGALAAEIRKTGSVTEALALAGDYLQTATGTLGDYLQYKRGVEAKGLVPEEYDSWRIKEEQRQSKAKSAEAYNTAYNTAAGKAAAEAKAVGTGTGVEKLYSGLNSATSTAVRAKVSKFSTEPIVQNFATIQDGYNFAKSLSDTTKNPADDQALIYSLAKALDPGSVVREGEYATAQKYAQSWISAYGKGVSQALAGTGFLSEKARQNIKDTIESKYNSTKSGYDNLYNKYGEGINSLTGRSDGKDFLIDYSNKVDPATEVDNWVKDHPDQAETVAKAYEVPGATDQDVLDYLQLLTNK